MAPNRIRRRASSNPATRRCPRNALRSLHRLNLVDLDRSGYPVTLVRVHDLVQRATRDPLNENELGQAVRVAADALVGRCAASGA
jgi:hypothetical protein